MRTVNPKISVIVPVYNVEDFLPKCINSLIDQTYKNYEIILVDDGSTDRSGDICDEYSKTINNIIVFHKENGGLSDARNYGVKCSKNEYIIFVDSDDYVDSEYLTYLVYLKNKFNCDLSVSGYIEEDTEANEKRLVSFSEETLLNQIDALKEMCYGQHFPIMAWGKLYKRSTLINNQYPLGELNEDVGTTYKIIENCKKIGVGKHAFYHYVERKQSILHSSSSLYGVKASVKMIDSFKKEYTDNDLIDAGYVRFAIESIGALHRVVGSKNKYKKYSNTIKKMMKKEKIKVFDNKRLSFSKRMQISLFRISSNLYRYVYIASCLVKSRKSF
ncbi:glycosyltransferase family 2 protein [Limosilactobacillus vaginalis]|uniref:glycosyltransferase family 2 protein n=1 Tax=Limosilactobacillus vaginalis TaxID=1633 RepID=UPI0025A43083|nr:glycosyltransferase family 2 protein [Limosilactobacillus vaginalis]MDM8222233.1 glycosyltransferase family 2 protein [Limosilactobacillus vaginalis]MDM8264762.1 glycosyltransferase family 2 protein [Limosilactobacillus vaginalis]